MTYLRSSMDPFNNISNGRRSFKTEGINVSLKDISPIAKKVSITTEYSPEKSFFANSIGFDGKDRKFYEKPSPILKEEIHVWNPQPEKKSQKFIVDEVLPKSITKENLETKSNSQLEDLIQENTNLKISLEKFMLKNEQKNKTIKSLYKIVRIKENDFEELFNEMKSKFLDFEKITNEMFAFYEEKINNRLASVNSKIEEFMEYLSQAKKGKILKNCQINSNEIKESDIDDICLKLTKFPIESIATHPLIIKFSKCILEYNGKEFLNEKEKKETQKNEISEIFSESSNNKSIGRIFLLHKNNHKKYRARIRTFINTISSQMQGFAMGQSFQLEYLISLKKYFDQFITLPHDVKKYSKSLKQIENLEQFLKFNSVQLRSNIGIMNSLEIKNSELLSSFEISISKPKSNSMKDKSLGNPEMTRPEISFPLSYGDKIIDRIEKLDLEILGLNTNMIENIVSMEDLREFCAEIKIFEKIDFNETNMKLDELVYLIKGLNSIYNKDFDQITQTLQNFEQKLFKIFHQQEIFNKEILEKVHLYKKFEKQKVEKLKSKIKEQEEQLCSLEEINRAINTRLIESLDRIQELEENQDSQYIGGSDLDVNVHSKGGNSRLSLGSQIFDDLKFQIVNSQANKIKQLESRKKITMERLSQIQTILIDISRNGSQKVIKNIAFSISEIFESFEISNSENKSDNEFQFVINNLVKIQKLNEDREIHFKKLNYFEGNFNYLLVIKNLLECSFKFLLKINQIESRLTGFDSMDKVINQISEMRNQIIEKNLKISNLKSLLKEKCDIILEFKQNIQILESNIKKDGDTQILELMENIKFKEIEIFQLNENFRQSEIKSQKFQLEIQNLNGKLNNFEKQNTNLNQIALKFSEIEVENIELKDSNSKLEIKISQLKDTLEEINYKQSQAQEECKKLNIELKYQDIEYKENLIKFNNIITDLDCSYANILEQNKESLVQANNILGELSIIRDKETQINVDFQNMNDNLIKYQSNIEKIETENIERNKLIDEELQKSSGILIELQNLFMFNTKTQIENELLETQDKLRKLEFQTQEYLLEIEGKFKDNIRINSLYIETKSRLEKFEESFGNKEEYIKGINTVLQEREDYIANLNNENQTLRHDIIIKESNLKENEIKISTLTNELENLIKSHETELNNQNSKIENLENNSIEKDGLLKVSISKNGILEGRIEELQQLLSASSNLLFEIKTESQQMNHEFKELDSIFQTLVPIINFDLSQFSFNIKDFDEIIQSKLNLDEIISKITQLSNSQNKELDLKLLPIRQLYQKINEDNNILKDLTDKIISIINTKYDQIGNKLVSYKLIDLGNSEMHLITVDNLNQLFEYIDTIDSKLTEARQETSQLHHKIEELNIENSEKDKNLEKLMNDKQEIIFGKDIEIEVLSSDKEKLSSKLTKQEKYYENKLKEKEEEYEKLISNEIQGIEKIKSEYESCVIPMKKKFKDEMDQMKLIYEKKENELILVNNLIRSDGTNVIGYIQLFKEEIERKFQKYSEKLSQISNKYITLKEMFHSLKRVNNTLNARLKAINEKSLKTKLRFRFILQEYMNVLTSIHNDNYASPPDLIFEKHDSVANLTNEILKSLEVHKYIQIKNLESIFSIKGELLEKNNVALFENNCERLISNTKSISKNLSIEFLELFRNYIESRDESKFKETIGLTKEMAEIKLSRQFSNDKISENEKKIIELNIQADNKVKFIKNYFLNCKINELKEEIEINSKILIELKQENYKRNEIRNQNQNILAEILKKYNDLKEISLQFSSNQITIIWENMNKETIRLSNLFKEVTKKNANFEIFIGNILSFFKLKCQNQRASFKQIKPYLEKSKGKLFEWENISKENKFETNEINEKIKRFTIDNLKNSNQAELQNTISLLVKSVESTKSNFDLSNHIQNEFTNKFQLFYNFQIKNFNDEQIKYSKLLQKVRKYGEHKKREGALHIKNDYISESDHKNLKLEFEKLKSQCDRLQKDIEAQRRTIRELEDWKLTNPELEMERSHLKKIMWNYFETIAEDKSDGLEYIKVLLSLLRFEEDEKEIIMEAFDKPEEPKKGLLNNFFGFKK